MRRNVLLGSTPDSGHLDDDEVAVVRQVRVPPGRPEIGVVDEREFVPGQREHGLDGLVRELERVAEAEVAGTDRVLGDRSLSLMSSRSTISRFWMFGRFRGRR